MKERKRKNILKFMEELILFVLQFELIYITYNQVLTFKKTICLIVSIAIAIALLKNEK